MKKEDDKRVIERETARLLALSKAEQYCKENGLSFDKLSRQRFRLIYESAMFLQPSGVKPNGLVNDIETQPKPTLIIENKNGRLVVEETEYTRKYLALQ